MDIPTAIYCPSPNHCQAPYRAAPQASNGLPIAEHLHDHVFSIPMHPYLEADTQSTIQAAPADK